MGPKPEELIEESGSNKGMVSDIETAQVGAEAEKESRDRSPLTNYVEFKVHKSDVYGIRAENPKEFRGIVGDIRGQEAMEKKVYQESYNESIQRKISPAAAKIKAEEDVVKFKELQNKLTNERINEELGR